VHIGQISHRQAVGFQASQPRCEARGHQGVPPRTAQRASYGQPPLPASIRLSGALSRACPHPPSIRPPAQTEKRHGHAGLRGGPHGYRDETGSCAAVPPALKGVQQPPHGCPVRRAEGLQLAGGERLDKTCILLDTSPIVRFYADDSASNAASVICASRRPSISHACASSRCSRRCRCVIPRLLGGGPPAGIPRSRRHRGQSAGVRPRRYPRRHAPPGRPGAPSPRPGAHA
jgi:hypothetical protein